MLTFINSFFSFWKRLIWKDKSIYKEITLAKSNMIKKPSIYRDRTEYNSKEEVRNKKKELYLANKEKYYANKKKKRDLDRINRKDIKNNRPIVIYRA